MENIFGTSISNAFIEVTGGYHWTLAQSTP
jgi:hypothetical protein